MDAWDLYMLIRYIDFFDVLVYSFVLYEKFVLLLNFELVVKRNVLKMFVYFKNCLDCYCNVDFYQFVLVFMGFYVGVVVFK